MLECKVCGTKFNAIIERHYIARDNGKTGLAVAFGSTAEESLYDTFDCPMCGCQVIAKERKRDYIPFISTDQERLRTTAMSIWLDMLPVVLKSTLKTEKENNKP